MRLRLPFFLLLVASLFSFKCKRTVSDNSTYETNNSSSSSSSSSLNISDVKFALSEEQEKEIVRLNTLIASINSSGDKEGDIVTVQSVIDTIIKNDRETNTIDKESGIRTINNEVLRLYAIGADILQNCQGIVYRLRNLTDSVKIFYSYKLLTLRQWYRLKDEHAHYLQHIFDYVVDPNPGKEILGLSKSLPFHSLSGNFNVSELQNWLVQNVIPFLSSKVQELDELINNDPNLGRAIARTSTRLMLGNKRHDLMHTHLSGSIYSAFGEFGQFNRMISAYQLRQFSAYTNYIIGSLYYFSSYNWDGYNILIDEMYKHSYFSNEVVRKKAALIGSFIPDNLSKVNPLNDIIAMPEPKIRKQILDKVRSSFSKFGTYRNCVREDSEAEDCLIKAKRQIIEGSEKELNYLKILNSLDGKDSNNTFRYLFVNPDEVKNYLFLAIDQVQNRLTAYESGGEATLTDRLTGEKYKVNVSNFFNGQQVKDWVAFYPDGFAGYENEYNKLPRSNFTSNEKVSFSSEDKYKWNYEFGRPTHWGDSTFGGVLPDSKNPKFQNGNIVNKDHNVIRELYVLNKHNALPFIGRILSLLQ
ncbi:MAG: hypothetical protein R3B45_03500 [Bdellovibrionota bacterium]